MHIANILEKMVTDDSRFTFLLTYEGFEEWKVTASTAASIADIARKAFNAGMPLEVRDIFHDGCELHTGAKDDHFNAFSGVFKYAVGAGDRERKKPKSDYYMMYMVEMSRALPPVDDGGMMPNYAMGQLFKPMQNMMMADDWTDWDELKLMHLDLAGRVAGKKFFTFSDAEGSSALFDHAIRKNNQEKAVNLTDWIINIANRYGIDCLSEGVLS